MFLGRVRSRSLYQETFHLASGILNAKLYKQVFFPCFILSDMDLWEGQVLATGKAMGGQRQRRGSEVKVVGNQRYSCKTQLCICWVCMKHRKTVSIVVYLAGIMQAVLLGGLLEQEEDGPRVSES